MSYGSSKWQDWVLDEEQALPLLEHAYKRGINTWDTVCPQHPHTPLSQTNDFHIFTYRLFIAFPIFNFFN